MPVKNNYAQIAAFITLLSTIDRNIFERKYFGRRNSFKWFAFKYHSSEYYIIFERTNTFNMFANASGTKCPNCQKSGFELVEDSPSGSAWKMSYIRCTSCKTFLQALYPHNISLQIENLHEALRGKFGIQ